MKIIPAWTRASLPRFHQTALGHVGIIFISLSYLPNPSARAGYDTRSIF